MDSEDATRHSFIIRIWCEDADTATGRVVWRGSITHVPDGRRRLLKDLEEIREFITSYLRDMGVKPAFGFPFQRWLERWRW